MSSNNKNLEYKKNKKDKKSNIRIAQKKKQLFMTEDSYINELPSGDFDIKNKKIENYEQKNEQNSEKNNEYNNKHNKQNNEYKNEQNNEHNSDEEEYEEFSPEYFESKVYK